MSWTDGIDDGGWGEFGYGNVAQDDAVAAIGEAMAGTQGMGLGGPVGPSSGGSADAFDESNNPTFSFTSGKALGPQIDYANAVKAAMSFATPLGAVQWGGRLLGSIIGNTRNSNFANRAMLDAGLRAQYTDPNTYDFDNLTTTFTGPETERQGLISAKMSGFGARKGIATGIDPYTGLHVGPGYPMSEDFFPGYGVNPYTGDAMADPGDPYIRKKRGTEIVGMVGP